jgi:four helix bundle protein
MTIKDFRELRVYQTAFESAMDIFHLSTKWPTEERYSLTNQIRRSSRSVCANIAEAWRKRRYPASFVSKMSDADGEAGETLVWLDFGLRCGYLPSESHAPLVATSDHICAQLVTMINQSDKWCSA